MTTRKSAAKSKKPALDASKVRALLQTELNEVRESIKSHTLRAQAEISSDFDESAQQRAARQLLKVRIIDEEKRASMIEQALVRLTNGLLGVCVNCRAPISAQRMEAIPYALRCIRCKAIYEAAG